MDVFESELHSNALSSGAMASLIVIIGEASTTRHKTLILERISNELQHWDVHKAGCDLNRELDRCSNSLFDSTSAADTVRQCMTDKLSIVLLLNPSHVQVRKTLQTFFADPQSVYRHLVYSGLAVSGSGCWLLRDRLFAYGDLCSVFETAGLTKNTVASGPERHIIFSVFGQGHWTQARLSRGIPTCHVAVNPSQKTAISPTVDESVSRFIDRLSDHINVGDNSSSLTGSDQPCVLGFKKPTVYIFPGGGDGNAAVFGVQDLSLVYDTGYGHRPAFWDFVRHFSRIDVMVVSHAGPENFPSAQSLVEKMSNDRNAVPQIGHVICNAPSPNIHLKSSELSLLVPVPDDIVRMSKMLHEIGLPPCVAACAADGRSPLKMNLYHKVNQGCVDLYVVNPVQNSRELKEFMRQCEAHAPSFVSNGAIPLTNSMSVVAALVWKPVSKSEKVVRVLFPGSAPLYKVLEGMERLRGIDVFESLSGLGKDLKEPSKKQPADVTTARSGSAKPAARVSATKPAAAVPEPKPPVSKTVKDSERGKESTKPKEAEKSREPPKGREIKNGKENAKEKEPEKLKEVVKKIKEPVKGKETEKGKDLKKGKVLAKEKEVASSGGATARQEDLSEKKSDEIKEVVGEQMEHKISGNDIPLLMTSTPMVSAEEVSSDTQVNDGSVGSGDEVKSAEGAEHRVEPVADEMESSQVELSMHCETVEHPIDADVLLDAEEKEELHETENDEQMSGSESFVRDTDRHEKETGGAKIEAVFGEMAVGTGREGFDIPVEEVLGKVVHPDEKEENYAIVAGCGGDEDSVESAEIHENVVPRLVDDSLPGFDSEENGTYPVDDGKMATVSDSLSGDFEAVTSDQPAVDRQIYDHPVIDEDDVVQNHSGVESSKLGLEEPGADEESFAGNDEVVDGNYFTVCAREKLEHSVDEIPAEGGIRLSTGSSSPVVEDVPIASSTTVEPQPQGLPSPHAHENWMRIPEVDEVEENEEVLVRQEMEQVEQHKVCEFEEKGDDEEQDARDIAEQLEKPEELFEQELECGADGQEQFKDNEELASVKLEAEFEPISEHVEECHKQELLAASAECIEEHFGQRGELEYSEPNVESDEKSLECRKKEESLEDLSEERTEYSERHLELEEDVKCTDEQPECSEQECLEQNARDIEERLECKLEEHSETNELISGETSSHLEQPSQFAEQNAEYIDEKLEHDVDEEQNEGNTESTEQQIEEHEQEFEEHAETCKEFCREELVDLEQPSEHSEQHAECMEDQLECLEQDPAEKAEPTEELLDVEPSEISKLNAEKTDAECTDVRSKHLDEGLCEHNAEDIEKQLVDHLEQNSAAADQLMSETEVKSELDAGYAERLEILDHGAECGDEGEERESGEEVEAEFTASEICSRKHPEESAADREPESPLEEAAFQHLDEKFPETESQDCNLETMEEERDLEGFNGNEINKADVENKLEYKGVSEHNVTEPNDGEVGEECPTYLHSNCEQADKLGFRSPESRLESAESAAEENDKAFNGDPEETEEQFERLINDDEESCLADSQPESMNNLELCESSATEEHPGDVLNEIRDRSGDCNAAELVDDTEVHAEQESVKCVEQNEVGNVESGMEFTTDEHLCVNYGTSLSGELQRQEHLEDGTEESSGVADEVQHVVEEQSVFHHGLSAENVESDLVDTLDRQHNLSGEQGDEIVESQEIQMEAIKPLESHSASTGHDCEPFESHFEREEINNFVPQSYRGVNDESRGSHVESSAPWRHHESPDKDWKSVENPNVTSEDQLEQSGIKHELLESQPERLESQPESETLYTQYEPLDELEQTDRDSEQPVTHPESWLEQLSYKNTPPYNTEPLEQLDSQPDTSVARDNPEILDTHSEQLESHPVSLETLSEPLRSHDEPLEQLDGHPELLQSHSELLDNQEPLESQPPDNDSGSSDREDEPVHNQEPLLSNAEPLDSQPQEMLDNNCTESPESQNELHCIDKLSAFDHEMQAGESQQSDIDFNTEFIADDPPCHGEQQEVQCGGDFDHGEQHEVQCGGDFDHGEQQEVQCGGDFDHGEQHEVQCGGDFDHGEQHEVQCGGDFDHGEQHEVQCGGDFDHGEQQEVQCGGVFDHGEQHEVQCGGDFDHGEQHEVQCGCDFDHGEQQEVQQEVQCGGDFDHGEQHEVQCGGDFDHGEQQEVQQEVQCGGDFDPIKDWEEPVGLPAPTEPAAKLGSKKLDDSAKKGTSGVHKLSGAAGKAAERPLGVSPKVDRKAAVASSPRREASKATSAAAAAAAAAGGSDGKKLLEKSPESSSGRSSDSGKFSVGASPAAKKPTQSSTAAAVKKVGAAKPAGSGKAAKPLPTLYFDVAYIPVSRNSLSIESDFFRTVCSSHYVLSCAEPSRESLDAIVEGKKAQLADRLVREDFRTLIITTYETPTLLEWLQDNSTELQRLNIEFTPSANRCIIELKGGSVGEESAAGNQCRAYRLEF